MNDLIVRAARVEEIATLLSFEQGIVKAERPFDNTLKEGEIHYYDLIHLIESPIAEVIVAEIDGELVGSGYALIKEAKPYLKHTHYAYLGFMYVKPEYRGQGINKAILEALKQWAISRNIREIRLEVYEDNIVAKKAYEKAGFKANLLEMRMELNAE
jgi:GNAT superfamily N-acetyltransferase